MEIQAQRYTLTRPARLVLASIIVVYVVLGSLYAVETPAWQAPDEPAHYNYIVHIATESRLPVLEQGNYPAEYLEELKALRFPPDLSIDPVRYESHQPPLYYAIAAPVYLGANAMGLDELLILRLFSVLLESLALWVGFIALYVLLRGRILWVALAVGLAALIPMHVATSAAVNSDVMAELLISLVALHVVQSRYRWTVRRCLGLGILLGLCALTKLQTYTAGAFALFALYHEATQGTFLPKRLTRAWLGRLAMVVGGAIVVLSPWLVRNALVYGPADLLALGRHADVVVGQLTTQAYVSSFGWWSLVRAFCTTTFHSFWGQFGWMGVVLDRRLYALYAAFSLIALGGACLGLIRRRGEGTQSDGYALGILTVWLLVTSAGYIWWNLSFVQHQGRYLFPALLPICVGLSWGFEQALMAIRRWRLGLGFCVGAIMALVSYALGTVSRFDVALSAGTIVLLPVAGYVRRRWRTLFYILLSTAWAGLAVAILYRQVLPALL